jgi:hypothetical protein
MRISLSEAGRRPVEPSEGSSAVVLKSQLKKQKKETLSVKMKAKVKAKAVVNWPPRKERVGYKHVSLLLLTSLPVF